MTNKCRAMIQNPVCLTWELHSKPGQICQFLWVSLLPSHLSLVVLLISAYLSENNLQPLKYLNTILGVFRQTCLVTKAVLSVK